MNSSTTIQWLGVGVFIVLGVIILVFFSSKPSAVLDEYDQARITIGDQELTAFLANTPERQRRGLSGTKHLPEDHAMLFTFPEEGNHSFWMKDMKYPIDIFWFDADFELVRAIYDLSPDTYPQSFGYEVESKYVLETNPGALEVSPGETFSIQIHYAL